MSISRSPFFVTTGSGHIVMRYINRVTNLTFKIITALFAKALDGVNVKEMISNISSGAGAAPAAAAAPSAQAAAPAEDKKGNIGTAEIKLGKKSDG